MCPIMHFISTLLKFCIHIVSAKTIHTACYSLEKCVTVYMQKQYEGLCVSFCTFQDLRNQTQGMSTNIFFSNIFHTTALSCCLIQKKSMLIQSMHGQNYNQIEFTYKIIPESRRIWGGTFSNRVIKTLEVLDLFISIDSSVCISDH